MADRVTVPLGFGCKTVTGTLAETADSNPDGRLRQGSAILTLTGGWPAGAYLTRRLGPVARSAAHTQHL